MCTSKTLKLAFNLSNLNQGLESMHALAQKCIQLKPISSSHRLMGLIIGILGENTEV